MSVRFLLFRGSWEHEGKFCLLETSESIIVLATGQDFSLSGIQEQKIGRDYLKENKRKIKAIIVNNTSYQNIGLLADIWSELGAQLPIYTSFHSKLVLSHFFPRLQNKLVIVEKNKEVKMGDFSCYFTPLSSFLIGNLALKIHYSQYAFYFIEDFVFSKLLDNNVLPAANFSSDFQQFLTSEKRHTYLITSLQNMHWKNQNSLFFAIKNFPRLNKQLFFILYDFDWLHILELLEIVRKWGKKVRILNKEFFLLISKVLAKSALRKVISNREYGLHLQQNKASEGNNNEVYLLAGNPENIRKKLEYHLSSFSIQKKLNFHFVVGVPPMIGGEEKLARLVDYLYTQSQEITNLSKKEYLSLGASFYDFKLLLQILQPTGIISLQNSYKNEKFISYLPQIFSLIENGYAWDVSTKKISTFKAKKSLISLEELLVKQRTNLGQSGLLIILLTAEWEEQKLQLKTIKVEAIAMNSNLNIPKLENKIKNWWATRLVQDVQKNEPLKLIKKIVERRLNEKLRNYLSLEYDIELTKSLILLFNHKWKESADDKYHPAV